MSVTMSADSVGQERQTMCVSADRNVEMTEQTGVETHRALALLFRGQDFYRAAWNADAVLL